jgi:hypothetical protein
LQVRIVGWLELLAKARSESTVVDSATDLKQQIGAASGPTHLLTFVHPTVDQKIGGAFGDRSTNSQSGAMPLGVINQPVSLPGQIFIQRVQGSPQLSRGWDGFSRIGLTLEMVHDRSDPIDADPCVGGFAIPQPPVQALDLRDDHGHLPSPVINRRTTDHLRPVSGAEVSLRCGTSREMAPL